MMNSQAISCCFSGHRKVHFDMDTSYMGDIMQDALKAAIIAAIAEGYKTFLSGMAMGFDIIAAETVLKLKYDHGQDISLLCILPFRGQELKFSQKWRTRHELVLRNADKINALNEQYVTGCYYERNRYLVDHSSRLICLYGEKSGGTKHTFNYAEKSGIRIVNLWPEMEYQSST